MNKIKTSKKRQSRVMVRNLIHEVEGNDVEKQDYCEKLFNYLLNDSSKLKNEYLFAKSKCVIGVWYDDEYSYLVKTIADEYDYDEITIDIHDKKHLSDWVSCAKLFRDVFYDYNKMRKNGVKANEIK